MTLALSKKSAQRFNSLIGTQLGVGELWPRLRWLVYYNQFAVRFEASIPSMIEVPVLEQAKYLSGGGKRVLQKLAGVAKVVNLESPSIRGDHILEHRLCLIHILFLDVLIDHKSRECAKAAMELFGFREHMQGHRARLSRLKQFTFPLVTGGEPGWNRDRYADANNAAHGLNPCRPVDASSGRTRMVGHQGPGKQRSESKAHRTDDQRIPAELGPFHFHSGGGDGRILCHLRIGRGL